MVWFANKDLDSCRFRSAKTLCCVVLECMLATDKRVLCGVGRPTQVFCNALECCWQPSDDPSIPNCYFSRTLNTLFPQSV